MIAQKPLFNIILKAAAIYNIIWGLWVGLFPFALFDFAGLPRPNYPEIWQCVGMIVGVYGVGYWIASYDSDRHWPIVFVGFLGKIFGPIGFLHALNTGVYNLKFGLTIITNDLIWWVPFFLILRSAWTKILNPVLAPAMTEDEIKSHPDYALVFKGQWLIFFVRHAGCTFCREELSNLREDEALAKQMGLKVAVVHMGDLKSSDQLKSNYKLDWCYFISDPDQQLYRLFGMQRGTWRQLIGVKNWVRGFRAGVLKGQGIGQLEGDGKQMGGIVQLVDGKVMWSINRLHAFETYSVKSLQNQLTKSGSK